MLISDTHAQLALPRSAQERGFGAMRDCGAHAQYNLRDTARVSYRTCQRDLLSTQDDACTRMRNITRPTSVGSLFDVVLEANVMHILYFRIVVGIRPTPRWRVPCSADYT